MCLYNANTDCIVSVEDKERMQEVVSPRPNLFPRAYTKVVPRVERAHIVQEFCTTGTELFETYIIQLSSREIDPLPKTEDRSR